MSWTKDQIERVLSEIIHRSQSDAPFRRLCLEDPGAAVEQISGQRVPPNFKLRFVDNDKADLLVVLPDPSARPSGAALSDDELSTVAGGVTLGGATAAHKPQVVYTSPIVEGYCFAAGTPVLMADGSSRSIETLVVGDEVIAYDEDARRITVGAVSKTLHHEAVPIHRAVVEGVSRDLLLTTNHPFYTRDKWEQIGKLPAGSELFHYDPAIRESSPRRLGGVKPTGRVEPVYNLEVESAHTYFAGNLLVHNGIVGNK